MSKLSALGQLGPAGASQKASFQTPSSSVPLCWSVTRLLWSTIMLLTDLLFLQPHQSPKAPPQLPYSSLSLSPRSMKGWDGIRTFPLAPILCILHLSQVNALLLNAHPSAGHDICEGTSMMWPVVGWDTWLCTPLLGHTILEVVWMWLTQRAKTGHNNNHSSALPSLGFQSGRVEVYSWG